MSNKWTKEIIVKPTTTQTFKLKSVKMERKKYFAIFRTLQVCLEKAALVLTKSLKGS